MKLLFICVLAAALVAAAAAAEMDCPVQDAETGEFLFCSGTTSNAVPYARAHAQAVHLEALYNGGVGGGLKHADIMPGTRGYDGYLYNCACERVVGSGCSFNVRDEGNHHVAVCQIVDSEVKGITQYGKTTVTEAEAAALMSDLTPIPAFWPNTLGYDCECKHVPGQEDRAPTRESVAKAMSGMDALDLAAPKCTRGDKHVAAEADEEPKESPAPLPEAETETPTAPEPEVEKVVAEEEPAVEAEKEEKPAEEPIVEEHVIVEEPAEEEEKPAEEEEDAEEEAVEEEEVTPVEEEEEEETTIPEETTPTTPEEPVVRPNATEPVAPVVANTTAPVLANTTAPAVVNTTAAPTPVANTTAPAPTPVLTPEDVQEALDTPEEELPDVPQVQPEDIDEVVVDKPATPSPTPQPEETMEETTRLPSHCTALKDCSTCVDDWQCAWCPTTKRCGDPSQDTGLCHADSWVLSCVDEEVIVDMPEPSPVPGASCTPTPAPAAEEPAAEHHTPLEPGTPSDRDGNASGVSGGNDPVNVAACSGNGARLTLGQGNFTDGSDATSSYAHDRDCRWLIDLCAIGDVSVALDFTRFHTETFFDYVTLYDGNTTTSQVLGRFHGEGPSHEIHSSGCRMLVHFTSDSSLALTGFAAEYHAVARDAVNQEPCAGDGVVLRAPEGVFNDGTAANEAYDNYRDCRWLIDLSHLGAHVHVKLNFTRVDIEQYYDNVYVYDIVDGGSQRFLARVSGQHGPGDVQLTSHSNKVLVLFQSDFLGHGLGFELAYHQVADAAPAQPVLPIAEPTAPVQPDVAADVDVPPQLFNSTAMDGLPDSRVHNDSVTIDAPVDEAHREGHEADHVAHDAIDVANAGDACTTGAVLTGSSGVFTDGSTHGGEYSLNAHCKWLIDVSALGPNMGIKLWFSRFDTEAFFDSVMLFDGDSSEAHMIEMFSGSGVAGDDAEFGVFSGHVELGPDHARFSNGAHMFVEWYSDYSVAHDGWEARWEAVPVSAPQVVTHDACSPGGITLTHERFNFTDGSQPGYSYGNARTCEWYIDVSAFGEAGAVELSFSRFSTESFYDFVTIFDGADRSAPILAHLSGEDLAPIHVQSTGPHMLVEFVADHSVASDGFSATYHRIAASDVAVGVRVDAEQGCTFAEERVYWTDNYAGSINAIQMSGLNPEIVVDDLDVLSTSMPITADAGALFYSYYDFFEDTTFGVRQPLVGEASHVPLDDVSGLATYGEFVFWSSMANQEARVYRAHAESGAAELVYTGPTVYCCGAMPLAIDAAARKVYVALYDRDVFEQRVIRMDLNGQHQEEVFIDTDALTDMAIRGDRLLYTNTDAGELVSVDLDGGDSVVLASLEAPREVAVASDGTLFVHTMSGVRSAIVRLAHDAEPETIVTTASLSGLAVASLPYEPSLPLCGDDGASVTPTDGGVLVHLPNGDDVTVHDIPAMATQEYADAEREADAAAEAEAAADAGVPESAATECEACVHGRCFAGECYCEDGYAGVACELAAVIAQDCSEDEAALPDDACVHGIAYEGECYCKAGYIGHACALPATTRVLPHKCENTTAPVVVVANVTANATTVPVVSEEAEAADEAAAVETDVQEPVAVRGASDDAADEGEVPLGKKKKSTTTMVVAGVLVGGFVVGALGLVAWMWIRRDRQLSASGADLL